MAEVAKHTSKSDCWVVVAGQVLNVTNFLSQHPGGELAILTFAGKDATAEFDMIHPPDVISKYAPDAVIGELGAGGDEEGDIETGGSSGGGLASKKSMKVVARNTAPKHTESVDCIKGCRWHLTKMDCGTWWLVFLVVVFTALVVLSKAS